MKNEGDEAVRKQELDGLRWILADTFSLYFKTLNYHWNVEGIEFPFLHKLFEKQYEELFSATDEIAERIRALGEYIPGRYAELTHRSCIVEAQSVPECREMIQLLLEGHAAAAGRIRMIIPICQSAQDEASANLLADRLLSHEKMAWILGSCLKRTGEGIDARRRSRKGLECLYVRGRYPGALRLPRAIRESSVSRSR